MPSASGRVTVVVADVVPAHLRDDRRHRHGPADQPDDADALWARAVEAGAVARHPLDHHDNLYAGSVTSSTDFPVTPDAIQPHFGGGDVDGAIVKISLSHSRPRATRTRPLDRAR